MSQIFYKLIFRLMCFPSYICTTKETCNGCLPKLLFTFVCWLLKYLTWVRDFPGLSCLHFEKFSSTQSNCIQYARIQCPTHPITIPQPIHTELGYQTTSMSFRGHAFLAVTFLTFHTFLQPFRWFWDQSSKIKWINFNKL